MRFGITCLGWMALGIVISVASILTPTASAHDGLLFSDPVGGSSISTAPANLELTFWGHLSETGHQIDVRELRGTTLAVGTPQIQLLDEATIMLVPLPASVPAGTYTVTVTAVFPDGHSTLDSFLFTVTAGANSGSWQQYQDEGLVGLGLSVSVAGSVWWLHRTRRAAPSSERQRSRQPGQTQLQSRSRGATRKQQKQSRTQRAVQRR